MARIRSIHPGYAKSEDIAGPTGLSKLCRLHFSMLWTYCDDDGRGKDSIPLIKAEIWPLDDDVTNRKVESWMAELAKKGRITRYLVAGKRFFQVENWATWQHPQKRRPSNIPPPSLQEEDGSATRLLPDEDGSPPVGLSPVEGEGEGEVEGEGEGASGGALAIIDVFERFWRAYPRREAKGEARKAWDKAIKAAPPDVIIDAAEQYAFDPNRDPAFTAHPATWLNHERWLDDPQPRRFTKGQSALIRAQARGR